MPAYRYEAATLDGREEQGILEAESPRAVRTLLRQRDLTAVSVALLSDENVSGSATRHAVSAADLALITRQYSALLASGMTAERALDALVAQTESLKLREILAGARAEVRAGHSLAQAMSRYPKAFPDLYRALIRGGEDAGDLPRVMNELADHLESREAVRQKFALALLYPAVVTAVAALVIGGLMIYVVPQVAEVFTQTRQKLPLLTRALLSASAFLREAWPWLAMAIVIVVFGLRRAYRLPQPRRRMQLWMLGLPVIGRLFRLDAGARFASTLAIMLAGGVPMLKALATAAEGAGAEIFREAIDSAAKRVREGAPLGRALTVENRFPPLLIHFISNGELGGDLSGLLRHASRQLQNELDIRLRWFGGLIEPALIVGMGVVVLTIVLAVLMPIIEMNNMMAR
ncbi:MAG: type II secretion system F family protein [Betaproteobacteria bacterium]|nr:type II secretion system F family protein [Rhodocyclales bacterium]